MVFEHCECSAMQYNRSRYDNDNDNIDYASVLV
jgi:hypothetical protein